MKWYIGCCDQGDMWIGLLFLAMNESLTAFVFLKLAYHGPIGGICEFL